MVWKVNAMALLVGWICVCGLNICRAMQVTAPPSGSPPPVWINASDSGSEGRIRSLEATVRNMELELARLRQPMLQPVLSGPSVVDCTSSVCQPGNCGCCTASASRAGVYAGATLLFAKPHFKESFQVSNTSNLTGLMTLVPFEYDYELSPRIWFGFQNEQGVGVQASYWTFDGEGQSRNLTTDGTEIWGAHVVQTMFPANIFAAVPGSQMSVSDWLTAKTLNLVGTCSLELASVQILGGGGVRYAKLEQGMDAVVLSPAPNDFHQLSWLRRFEGVGPTLSVDAKKRLGNSRLSAVGSGGGALLYGSKTLQRTVINDQTPPVPAPPFLQLNDADEVVGVGELSLGLEWGAVFHNGNQLALRGVYEGQLWADAGAPTLGFLGFQGFGLQFELRR